MRSARLGPSALLVLLSLSTARSAPAETGLPSTQGIGHAGAVSDDEVKLEIDLTDRQSVSIAVVDGQLLIGGARVGTLHRAGQLGNVWRRLVEEATGLTPDQVLHRIQQLDGPRLTVEEREVLRTLEGIVQEISAVRVVHAAPIAPDATQEAESPQPPARVPAPELAPAQVPTHVPIDLDNLLESGRVYTRDLEIASGDVVDGAVTMLRGDVTVRGRVRGDIVAVDGDVILPAGGVVEGNVHLMRGDLIREGGELQGRVVHLGRKELEVPDVAPVIAVSETPLPSSPSIVGSIATGVMSWLGAFVGLAFMGIGLMFFAPRQLEAVADTVWHSFGRSFLAGLFAQPLLLPLLALLVVGLAITIVGILVVPFAVAAFVAAVLLSAVGGYLAVARTVGEIYLRRRMAKGLQVTGWLTYRYLFYGLLGVLMIWVPPVFFGRIPVAGTIMTVSAALLTWILVTAGFGATLVSRGGIRGTVVRRIDRALSDERFWDPSGLLARPRSKRRSAS